MEILLLIIGLAAGGVLGYLLLKSQQAANTVPKTELLALQNEFNNFKEQLIHLQAEKDTLDKQIDELATKLKESDHELKEKNETLYQSKINYSELNAQNKILREKLETQKQEIEDLGKKFKTEFENLANKILEEKSEKFTKTNRENIENLLKPLGENIKEFRTRVDEVYHKESKERFSLGERVKELAALNETISREARELTKALRSEAKTQGNWGEMILEKILELSGLRKGEEYFIEHQLLDDNGKPLISDQEHKKMRPDAVIKYPDNRSVIIDSKVSLTRFVNYTTAADSAARDAELKAHVASVKKHIDGLSARGYDDYDTSLDFVMMFVPSEPAYIAALQGDPNLWEYAYGKRILLLSPTNLITSLKLIAGLWKREYQNRNAIAIADRGAKLYDKFVSFVKNMENVGSQLEKAQDTYDSAFKQLSKGSGNLVSQALKLKELGIKNKAELPKEMEDTAGLAEG